MSLKCIRRNTVVIVSDRRAWSDSVVEIAVQTNSLTERWTWSETGRLVDPPDVLVVELDRSFEARHRALKEWADRAWQPICVASVTPRPGSSRLTVRLRGLGYRHLLPSRLTRDYWHDLGLRVRTILENRASLVPCLAKALECYDPAIIEVLSVALQMIPAHRTVSGWANEIGFRRRHNLECLFGTHGLPQPKTVLDCLRLACVVEAARRAQSSPTRDELARQFGYSSGDYLGKRAKTLTGRALGELLSTGVDEIFATLSKI
jgi:hypothetical protein